MSSRGHSLPTNPQPHRAVTLQMAQRNWASGGRAPPPPLVGPWHPGASASSSGDTACRFGRCLRERRQHILQGRKQRIGEVSGHQWGRAAPPVPRARVFLCPRLFPMPLWGLSSAWDEGLEQWGRADATEGSGWSEALHMETDQSLHGPQGHKHDRLRGSN